MASFPEIHPKRRQLIRSLSNLTQTTVLTHDCKQLQSYSVTLMMDYRPNDDGF